MQLRNFVVILQTIGTPVNTLLQIQMKTKTNITIQKKVKVKIREKKTTKSVKRKAKEKKTKRIKMLKFQFHIKLKTPTDWCKPDIVVLPIVGDITQNNSDVARKVLANNCLKSAEEAYEVEKILGDRAIYRHGVMERHDELLQSYKQQKNINE
ncbi:hypothetical protein RFI_37240 [Reticulomyxa filosa]|uniref:Uncharacterized protein n=1 Tax=Reticulomyxa filosa TaxID=46433 RepID=X6LGE6_RETFI|nr:hypothetical protein RFI_37240 [Reticulomyxa filosa]|eukprot:ETO00207.1 hypothetical protein RFI_37240 [Reticulomyxa filosa]